VRHVEGVFHPLQVGNQDGEFVAAQARQVLPAGLHSLGAQHQVAGADGFAQALGHGLEQMVADVVAQRVVDALEGIEVHEQHGEFLVVPCERSSSRSSVSRKACRLGMPVRLSQ
jgi:hypothetical protein